MSAEDPAAETALLDFYAGRPASAVRACRHCGLRRANRPRGLCWHCYYTPGVREQYPSVSKYAPRGPADVYRDAPAPTPTAAAPGSPEKVAVLEERARLGVALWHPLDAPMDREGAGPDVF